MHRAYFLIVTALVEVGTGLFLLILPAVPLELLIGVSQAAPEGLFIGRIAGAALLALGAASWLGRGDEYSPAHFGLLVGLLIYNAVVAALLGYAGLVLGMAGIALWPAVVLHTVLGAWCVACLLVKPRPQHSNEREKFPWSER
jgi:hypothetical protein